MQEPLRSRQGLSPWGIALLDIQTTCAAETQSETHFFSNEENAIWIKDYGKRQTALATQQVEDAEAAIRQEQNDKETAENMGLMTREPEKSFHEMMVAMWDSLRDIASSDNGEDGEDEDDEETEQGKVHKDDEPSRVMVRISKTVQQDMERFREPQMMLQELSEPEWKDSADYFHERNKMYGTSELKVLAVDKAQTEDDTAAHDPTTFGEHLESVYTHPWNIATAARDFSSRKESDDARFWETTVRHRYSLSCASHRARFIAYSETEACWTRNLLLLRTDRLAIYHNESGFGRRDSVGSCFCDTSDRPILIFDVISLWKAIFVPILLFLSIFLISVTKLWDMIICLWMCKGPTHHVTVLEPKSSSQMANKLNFSLPITV